MKIISRTGWGARAPRHTPEHVAPSRREFFVVHHSGAPAEQSVRAIQDWCMNGRGFADIDYNFLVDQAGLIYEGRGWDVVGAHCTDYNTSGIGICVIGNNQLSDAAKRAVAQLYRTANSRCGKTLRARPHRALATTGTDCPGDTIAAWLRAGMPLPAEPEKESPVALTVSDIPAIVRGELTLTEAAARRLGKKEGDKTRLDLALQSTLINAADGNQRAAELVTTVERMETAAKADSERLARVETLLEQLIASNTSTASN